MDSKRVSNSVRINQTHKHILSLIVNSTVAIVSLLDCAFFFFQNYPCRLTHSEMECDFPCDDSVWRSEHPFAKPNFRFTRDLTISDAFQYLFEDASKQDSPYRSPERNTLDLTVLDMFILIHCASTP